MPYIVLPEPTVRVCVRMFKSGAVVRVIEAKFAAPSSCHVSNINNKRRS